MIRVSSTMPVVIGTHRERGTLHVYRVIRDVKRTTHGEDWLEFGMMTYHGIDIPVYRFKLASTSHPTAWASLVCLIRYPVVRGKWELN